MIKNFLRFIQQGKAKSSKLNFNTGVLTQLKKNLSVPSLPTLRWLYRERLGPTQELGFHKHLLCHHPQQAFFFIWDERLPPRSSTTSWTRSQPFPSGGQIIGASASTPVLPVNTQDWSLLRWTGWISLQSKWLSRVFSNNKVQKHQFFGS